MSLNHQKFVFVRGMPSAIMKKRLIAHVMKKSLIPKQPTPKAANLRQKKEIKVVELETFQEIVRRAEEQLEKLRAEKRAIFVKISERNKRKRELTSQKQLISESLAVDGAVSAGGDGIPSSSSGIDVTKPKPNEFNPSHFNDHLDQNRMNLDRAGMRSPDGFGDRSGMRSPEIQDFRQQRPKENKFMKKSQFMQKRW